MCRLYHTYLDFLFGGPLDKFSAIDYTLIELIGSCFVELDAVGAFRRYKVSFPDLVNFPYSSILGNEN